MYTLYFSRWPLPQRPGDNGLSRGLLGLKYDQINYSDSDSYVCIYTCMCVYVCVCVCVRAWVRGCVRACVRAYEHA